MDARLEALVARHRKLFENEAEIRAMSDGPEKSAALAKQNKIEDEFWDDANAYPDQEALLRALGNDV